MFAGFGGMRDGRGSAVLVLVLAACSITEPYSNSGSELPERLGTAITGTDGMALGAGMLWSGDGAELYFEAADGSMRAVSLPQTISRTIDSPRDRDDLTVASAGNAIYFVAERNTNFASVFRAAQGQLTLLTDHAPVSTATGSADGTLVLSGPADSTVAYIIAPDSLFTYNIRTGLRAFVNSGCLRVVAFSPSGDQLICRTTGPRDAGYALVTLSSPSLAHLAPFVPEQGTMRIVRWEEDALRVLFSANNRFRIRNVDRGTSVTLWAPSTAAYLMRSLDFLHYSWSADGSRFAFWTHECLDVDRVGRCKRGQSVLYIVELKNNTGTMVAVVKGSRGGEQISMAPNGRAVAYVFDGRIYVQALP